jgi:branched-chain amino acid transport system substrate-binding protein
MNTNTSRKVSALNRRSVLRVTAGGLLVGSIFRVAGANAQATGPIKVGSLAPYTGPVARIGAATKEGTTLAVEDARADGDLPVKVDGASRHIELVWVDDQSSPEAAVKAVMSAIQRDGIQFLLNGYHSNVALAVMDVVVPYKVISFANMAASPSIGEKIRKEPEKYKGFFKGWPSTGSELGMYVEPLNYFLDKGVWKPATKVAAVLTEDTDYGATFARAADETVKKFGFEVPFSDIVPLDQTEFSSYITRYQAANVSLVVFNLSAPAGEANFLKQLHAQKLKALIVAHGLTWVSEWAQLTGDASNFALTMDSPLAISPEQKAWTERFAKKFSHEASVVESGMPYDYTRMFIKTLAAAGTLDMDKVISQIEGMHYKGVFNGYQFATQPNQFASYPHEIMTGPFMQGLFYPMVQLMNGEKKVVYPVDFKEADLRLPDWV